MDATGLELAQEIAIRQWRLKQRRYLLILAGIVALVLIIGLGFTLMWLASRAAPFFGDSVSFYAETSQNNLVPADAYFLEQLSGLSQSQAQTLISQAEEARGTRWGLIRQGDKLTVFVQDPTQDVANSTSQLRKIGQGHTFVLLGQDLSNPPDFSKYFDLRHLWLIGQLAKLSTSQDMAVLWQTGSEWFVGAAKQENGNFYLKLGKNSSEVTQNLVSTSFPSGSLYIEQKGQPAPSVAIPWLAALPAAWSQGSSSLWVQQGSVSRFIQAPYDPSLAWELRGSMAVSQANDVLSQQLDQLSHAYPRVEDRQLPDGSTIAELHQDAQAFLPPGQGLDLNKQTQGTLTYPDGELKYTYSQGTLDLQKGSLQPTNKMPFSCLVPDASVSGYADSSASDAFLWRTLQFSISSQELAMCISPE